MNIILFIIFVIFLFIIFIYFSTLISFFTTKVPFILTPRRVRQEILKEVKIKTKETVYDLGCGLGEILILADKKYNAQSRGFEVSPGTYLLARLNIFFKRSKAKVLFKDFFKVDLSNADVIFCYLIPSINEKLRRKLEKELKNGARIASYAFSFKGWKAKKVIYKNSGINSSPIYLYQWPQAVSRI